MYDTEFDQNWSEGLISVTGGQTGGWTNMTKFT